MSILSWIEDQKLAKKRVQEKVQIKENDLNPLLHTLWVRCEKCNAILYVKHLDESHKICNNCENLFKMNSNERIKSLVDGEFYPLDSFLSPVNPLDFVDQKPYTERLNISQSSYVDMDGNSLQDAVQTGLSTMDEMPIALGVMDFDFMGGSMGSVVGEKITRLIEFGTKEGLPVILVCASGGARMQEGPLSLMQMAKISSALDIHQNQAHLPYFAVLTSPTTGGVTASFAMLGNVSMAEPESIIAFAGRRVIEQTLREELPKDFQTAEYLLKHGLVDIVIPRQYIKQALIEFLYFFHDAPHKEQGLLNFLHQENESLLNEELSRRSY